MTIQRKYLIKLTRIQQCWLRIPKDNKSPPEFGSQNDFFEKKLPPGVYELVDINNTIKQILSDSDFGFELNIQADTLSVI